VVITADKLYCISFYTLPKKIIAAAPSNHHGTKSQTNLSQISLFNQREKMNFPSNAAFPGLPLLFATAFFILLTATTRTRDTSS
jgi:hypothetical protein